MRRISTHRSGDNSSNQHHESGASNIGTTRSVSNKKFRSRGNPISVPINPTFATTTKIPQSIYNPKYGLRNTTRRERNEINSQTISEHSNSETTTDSNAPIRSSSRLRTSKMKDNRAEVIEINSDDEAVFESDEEIGIIRRPTKRRLIQHPSEEDKSDETKTRKHTLNSTDSTTLRRRSMRSPINTTLMTPLKVHKTPMIECDSSTSPIRKIPECAIKISREPEKLMSPFKRLYSDKRAFEDSNQNQHNACVEGSRLYKKLKSKNEIDNEKGSNEIVTYGNESDKQNIPILSYPKETSLTSTKQNAEINDSSCVKEKSFIERLSERTSQAAQRDLIKKYLNMNQDKIPKEEDTDNTLLFNSQNSGIKSNTTRDEPSLSPLKDTDKQQKKQQQQQQQQQKTSLKMTGDTLSSVNQEIIHLDMDDEKEKCKYRATSHESFTRSTHPIKTSPKTSSPIPIQVPLKSSSSPVKDIITVTLHDQMDDYKPEPIGNDEHLLMYPFDGKNSITLYERDYSRLDEGTYLNDTLIDIFPKIWANDYPSTNIHTFSSFFFTKLSGSAATAIQYDTVKRWTANINIFEKKFVVVPVAQNNHWFIILVVNPSLCIPNSKDTCEDGHKSKVLYAGEVLDREKPYIMVLDPLNLYKQKPAKVLLKYLKMEALHKLNILESNFIEPDIVLSSCPGQKNFTDCGVFCLHYVMNLYKYDNYMTDILFRNKEDDPGWDKDGSLPIFRQLLRRELHKKMQEYREYNLSQFLVS